MNSVQSKIFVISLIVTSYLLLVINTVSAQSVYEGTDVPYIHPRSEWLTTPELQNLFNWYPYNPKAEGEIPDYYPVSRIIIHDTACNASRPGCNDETVPTVTTLQNIFRFHAVTRGWGDIGYHFIIDRKGEIWEGRYGGNGVRGAHLYNSKTCQNFNVGSIGITLIGNYFDAPIPQPMLQSLNHLTAWLALINDIDLQGSPETPIWTNAKDSEGKCQTENKGFTTTYAGPALLTHREIEPANSDVKNIDLLSAKNQAAAFAQELKSYAFKEVGSETLYAIEKTKLQSIVDAGKKIVTLIKSQLDFLRPERFARKFEPVIAAVPQVPTFPDGTLLRETGKEEVYFIKNQKRIHISSASLFNGLGLDWNTIKEEGPVVNSLTMADPIVFPNGILLQAQTPDVYYVQNSKRYLISSPEQFSAHKFKWEDIAQLTLPELDRYYPWGGYTRWPNGSVLQNKFNAQQIVVVENDALEPVAANSVQETPINLVTGRELASYQTAQVAAPTLTLALTEAFNAVKGTLGIQNSPVIATPPISPTLPITPIISEPIIKIALCKNRETKNCPFAKEDILEITADDNGIATVKGYEDHPGFNVTLNDNKFRGKVYTANQPDGTVWLINELSLEDYVKGIAETLGNDAPEYRKTLITIARTYAYYYIVKEKRYPDKPYDLTNTSSDQVYRGFAYEERSNGLGQIVDDTRGKIITFQGTPIVGAFSSDSGGVTKNPCPSIFPKYCDASGALKPEFNYFKGGIADPERTIHDKAKIAASHGVGVSTTGARRLIELGKTPEEIIKYYYPGVEIQKLY